MFGHRSPSREFIVTLIVLLAIVFSVLGPCQGRAREEARRIRCGKNLKQLAAGMQSYLRERGDSDWFPFALGRGTRPDDFNGAEWLASLYWTGIVPDPGVYICPSCPDDNHGGADLGTHHAVRRWFGSATVSYAGMHYRSLTDADGTPMPAAIPDDFPPNEPMACDDTQGAINHGTRANSYMSVVFFDHHVEGKTHVELDPERAVGEAGGLLWRLRN